MGRWADRARGREGGSEYWAVLMIRRDRGRDEGYRACTNRVSVSHGATRRRPRWGEGRDADEFDVFGVSIRVQ